MKTFMQWVEEHDLDLPIVTDTEEGQEDGKGAISEKAGKNFGYNYPAAYKRGQYMNDNGPPSPYFMSKTSDALYKMTKKARRVPDTAAN